MLARFAEPGPNGLGFIIILLERTNWVLTEKDGDLQEKLYQLAVQAADGFLYALGDDEKVCEAFDAREMFRDVVENVHNVIKVPLVPESELWTNKRRISIQKLVMGTSLRAQYLGAFAGSAPGGGRGVV